VAKIAQVMATLGIEQAARVSGRSARELRMLIESGRLPATRPSGRWLVEQRHLAVVESGEPAAIPTGDAPAERPRVTGGRPIGADPIAPILDIRASRVEHSAPEPEPEAEPRAEPDLRAQLDQATAQVADLRMERDALRLKLREQVSSLQESLENAMEELDAARARTAELEARQHETTSREAGTGARAALTPLFQATTLPPQRRKD
jgi:hypothetical protein